MDAPIRHINFRAAGGDGDGDGLRLVGLATPFGDVTRIDNYFEGTFDERFAPGAFKRTLGQRTPVMQFDHGTHPLVGSLPLGRFVKLSESKRGLEVYAEVFDNWLTEPIRDAIRGGSINGMSIRFRPVRVSIIEADARTDGGDVELRTVEEAELFELGPVVFPAYPTTEVDMRFSGDLSNESDRRRLAEALLVASPQVGQGPTSSPEPGTTPEAGVLADRTGPADGHPDEHQPTNTTRSRAARARLIELENETR